MRAAVAVSQDYDNPLAGLVLAEHPAPEVPEGWSRVQVKAAALNPHDVWTLRGVGHPPERLPIVLGCEAAGVTDSGREVVIHPVLADALRGGGDQTLDPSRALLSETIDGTLADYVVVPNKMIVDKPSSLNFAQAACLGVAWGTAYRMLFTRGNVRPGDRVLVQGSSGGVASAAIALARAAGATVYATGRSEEKRQYALEQGAHVAVEAGTRLPERVDLVIETVGEATWAHSLRAVRPGGSIVVAGATSGAMPAAELQRIFYQQISIVGSTGCTLDEFEALCRVVETAGLIPAVETIGFSDIALGFQKIIDGNVAGKVVVAFD